MHVGRRLRGRRRPGLLGYAKGNRCMALGFERRDPRSRIFLGLQVCFGTRDRRLSGVEIARRPFRRTGDPGRGDRLARIAHFLHGWPAAAGEANET